MKVVPMKKSVFFVNLIALIVAFVQPCNAITPWLHVEGNQLKDSAGNQVVLHGVSFREISWGGLNVNSLLDKITNANDKASHSPGWYTRLVRMPIDPGTSDWNQYNQNVIKPAVDYATQKGLYVILDLHYVDETTNNVNNTNNCWRTLAPFYKNYPNVIFEPYNEPINLHGDQSWTLFKPIMQAWVDTIRRYAPRNIIFAGSPQWDQIMGDADTDSLTGGNIVYVIHMYARQWAVQSIRDQVLKCVAAHPMVCTEWGYQTGWDAANEPNESTSGYGRPLLTWFDSLKISWTAWCADNTWYPIMFDGGWNLLVDDNTQMGGFVKDWLYTYRDSLQPSNTPPPVNVVSGIKQEHSSAVMVLNEHEGVLNIIMPTGNRYRARIIGLNGKIVAQRISEGGTVTINTAKLLSGCYVVSVKSNDLSEEEHRIWIK